MDEKEKADLENGAGGDAAMITREYAEKVFDELLAFQGYGFCLSYDTLVECPDGPKRLGDLNPGDLVMAPGGLFAEVGQILPNGEQDAFTVTLESGMKITSTLEHPFLCEDGGTHTLNEVIKNNLKIAARSNASSPIETVEYAGKIPVMDISLKSDSHLFYANGMIVSNCKAHAVCYSMYSAIQMWLQEHYFLEYMCVLLSHIDRAVEKKGHRILNERVEYCIRHGTIVKYPDVRESGSRWEICGATLLAPLKNIKGFNDRDVKIIEENRPYASLEDFAARTKFNENKLRTLMYARALDGLGGGVSAVHEWLERRNSTREDNFSLFGEEDAGEDIVAELPQTELRERCMDINGFVIPDNLLSRFSELVGARMSAVDWSKYPAVPKAYSEGRKGRLNRTIMTVAQARDAGPTDPEKPERSRLIWVLAQIADVKAGMRTKSGSPYVRLRMTDGCDDLEVRLYSQSPGPFTAGLNAVFPVSVSFMDDGSRWHSIDKYVCEEYDGPAELPAD